MKKFTKKILVALVAVMAVVCLSVSLAACGGEKKPTATYMSDCKYTYSNMAPTYNYRVLTFIGEQIEVYEDDTYCLTINAVSYSNVTFGENIATGKETANPQTNTIDKYYGTYTSTTDSEGDITLKLEKPTRVVSYSKGRIVLDSDASWTEEMAKAVTVSGFTTQQVVDADGNNLTGATYLEYKLGEFNGAEIFVNGTTLVFEPIMITAVPKNLK